MRGFCRSLSLVRFSIVCAEGSFGLGCSQRCQCSDDVTCDPVAGTCICPMGKMGSKCDKGKMATFFLTSTVFYFENGLLA